ncbi:MAG: MATE family efflux transporter [Bacteroidales bacterium]|nr:MATE family efflux transporter [Bacteroidales bacterium]
MASEAVSKAIPTELGTERIGSLLKKYAIPAIIAMTASSLYNMVDSIFIGQGVGALAISGLAVTFPLMNLSTAFGTLVGVGASTMLSVLLGQKNYKAAGKVLSNVVSLNIIIGFIFMIVALAFLNPILMFFGASENTVGYAADYMKIILYGNIITHLYFGLNAAMRATGNPRTAMGLTLFTVIFNTILDPIMIFALDMGIKGAAIATVISQAAALVIVIKKFYEPTAAVHFDKGFLKLNWKIARDSMSIGMGPFLMNSASCIVTLFINQQLLKYVGDLGVGAFGICNRLTFIFIMMCMGFNQGMQPIAGYNYGARKYSRVKDVYTRTVWLAFIVCALAFVISIFIPRTVCGIFTHDALLLDISSHGLRIMNCLILVVPFHMVTTNFFQCLGMVRKSIFLSLIRQLLYLVPLLYLLPLWLGAEGVWISFPVSDVLAFLTAMVLRVDLLRKLGRMKDGDDPSTLGSAI